MSNLIYPAMPVPCFLGLCPNEGPKSLPITLDFTNVASIDTDLMLDEAIGKIGFVQSVFIDNAANAATFKMTIKQSGQLISVAAGWQGYFQVVAGKPFMFNAATTQAALKILLQLLNVPVATMTWKAS